MHFTQCSSVQREWRNMNNKHKIQNGDGYEITKADVLFRTQTSNPSTQVAPAFRAVNWVSSWILTNTSNVRCMTEASQLPYVIFIFMVNGNERKCSCEEGRKYISTVTPSAQDVDYFRHHRRVRLLKNQNCNTDRLKTTGLIWRDLAAINVFCIAGFFYNIHKYSVVGLLEILGIHTFKHKQISDF